jgi:hypothetical protein
MSTSRLRPLATLPQVIESNAQVTIKLCGIRLDDNDATVTQEVIKVAVKRPHDDWPRGVMDRWLQKL